MTLIDPDTDLLALVAEDYRREAHGATFDRFRNRVGIGGHGFFGGFVQSAGDWITVTDDDRTVIARYSLQEVYRYLNTPRLPLA